MAEKKPAKPVKSIGTDPFADIADAVWQDIGVTPKEPEKTAVWQDIGVTTKEPEKTEVWQDIGVTPESPDTKAASPENTPSEKAALGIEIHDEADMALVAWLYGEESPPDEAATPAANGAVRDKP